MTTINTQSKISRPTPATKRVVPAQIAHFVIYTSQYVKMNAWYKVALGASAEWRLRSWDEFRIPKPFARCVLRFGDPIRVPGDADRAGQEAARKEIEAALHALSWQVDEKARA